MSIVSLAEKRKAESTDREKVVAMLREALAEAEAGEISGLVLVLSDADECWLNRWTGNFSPLRAIAKLEITKHELIAEYLETNK